MPIAKCPSESLKRSAEIRLNLRLAAHHFLGKYPEELSNAFFLPLANLLVDGTQKLRLRSVARRPKICSRWAIFVESIPA